MTKLQFLLSLNKKLSDLQQSEVEERLNFYSEMIEDRMEEGLSEEEAVVAVGAVDEIAAQIIADIPFSKNEKETLKAKKRLKTWEILLLTLGSPIWLSLAIAALAVILSLYVVLWSAVVSLWAVFASFVGVAVGGMITGVCLTVLGNTLSGIAMIGAALVCTGLAIFSFLACKALTKGSILLTKNTVLAVKKRLVRKEKAR